MINSTENGDIRTDIKKFTAMNLCYFMNIFQGRIEEKNMHVGPIWGNYEADKKVKAFMVNENMFENGWHWTGHWFSVHGSSYADFWRVKEDKLGAEVQNWSGKSAPF